jgi:hypothetical protein
MKSGPALARLRAVARIVGPCLLAAVALILHGEASATTFAPSLEVTLADTAVGANSAITVDLNISEPDSQLGNAISFVPPEFTIANGDSITNGAFTGNVTSAATLGLVGGSCNSTLNPAFDLMDASTDPSYTIDLYYGVNDSNGNGLPDNVDYYPSSLAYVAPDIVPLQRHYGQVLVAGVLVPINFAVFAPGTPLPLLPAFDAPLGYPTVTIIGDPLAVPGPTFPISDFCTPLAASVMLRGLTLDNPAVAGNEGGQALRANPAQAGSYNAVLFARGRYDADNDGIENGLDSCPLDPDPAWNPRADGPTGDADMDGLPDSCDPNDSDTNFDSDVDGFNNRLDLCPTFATNYLHYDIDRDGIGDACDPFPEDETNGGTAHRHQVCVADTLAIGSGGAGPPAWACPSGPDLPIPPRLILHPVEDFEAVGFVHSMYVYAIRVGGRDSAIGVTVTFEITGANPQTGSCLTGNYGDCEFNYLGMNAGLDTIVATATIDGFSVSDTSTNQWLGPPANDGFGAAAPVSGLPFEDTQLPLAATTEPLESAPCGGEISDTIWYTFTPPADTLITAEAESNGSPLILAAYTGASVGSLTPVRCDATYDNPFPKFTGAAAPEYYYEAYVSFWAQAGVTYHFQAGSQFGGFYGDPEVLFSIQETILGDANCSGGVNSIDALGVLRKSAGLSAPSCVGAADMNCDGNVNAIDALLILRVSAGLAPQPTSCPA